MGTIKDLALIIFSISMFINGSLFIPQVYKIIRDKSTKGVSLITFFGFNFIQLSAVVHGYLSGDYALAIGMGYSFVTCAMVTALIMFYRYKKNR